MEAPGNLGKVGGAVAEAWVSSAEAAGQLGESVFNASARREAVEKLRESLARHEAVRKGVAQASVHLFEQRQRAVVQVVEPIAEYVNRLANSPREFDGSVREYRIEVDRFENAVHRIETEAAKSAAIGSGTGVAGATAGVGLAAFGPSVAMAVATTFGTASTGTAISALSGAAAANAALAWLGGGALAAGGGGMAAGNTLLALAGPVGWTIGGVALAGSGIYLHYRNRDLARRAAQERVRAEGEILSLRTVSREIEGLAASTKTHTEGTLASIGWLRDNAPNDYQQFDHGQKERLAALVNHVRSVGELLRREVAL